MDTQIREDDNGALDTNQAQAKFLSSDINNPSFLHKNRMNATENIIDDKVGIINNTLEDVRSMIDGDESDGGENPTHSNNAPFLSTIEIDPHIWTPPAPVDTEEDFDSVANNDDDDEYSDGTKWGKPSSLNGYDEEHGNSFKEDRQKVIMDAMNGQFKLLVSRFLASEDITSEGWLDIISSLSWEAALLIKPEANQGRAMDPGSYIKVKCVASGDRRQSQVVKGLVFKKNTAHKHMPTKCKNPKLLLLQGVLGHREVGLSSFEAMEEENDYLKSINEMIETCHPNVVFVEKSVSRDIQEFLLKKGMTLVFDMKLTRLNRIARCMGSPILSGSDIVTTPKVKQCDVFHIEKFVEEHNSCNEGGKRPFKTLMFLEGFPKPLGCTIILKGAPIDELKKVKRVVQYTVFAAYHLILETSFFADQRASFSDINAEGNISVINSLIEEHTDGIGRAYTSDVPSSNGSLENSTHEAMAFTGSNGKPDGSSQPPTLGLDVDFNDDNHYYHHYKPNSNLVIEFDIPWQLMSSFSSSLKKFLSDSFTPINIESFSSYYGLSDEELDTRSEGDCHNTEANGDFIQGKALDEISYTEKSDLLSSINDSVPVENNNADVNSKDEVQNKNNIEKVLEPQSILILMSSQCIAKGIVCEQSHLSRIKYYGNFDVSLGRFLQDTLLNQKHICSSCGEPPEAHVYCYTHQNGNLTVSARQLDPKLSLSGEPEGRIWMWTRCLKCEQDSGIPSSTLRVVMSQAARGLSFGKFLELSFSSHSVASRLSSKCGHSLHRDCLRYFGLGSKVAMFRYSPVEIYAACKPPPVLEFNNANGLEWIRREAKLVLKKGDIFFLEVANFLQKLKRGDFSAVKDLRQVEEMLIQEKSEFEQASLLKAINFSGKQGKTVNDILSLSWLSQELRFQLYIWDCRIKSLLQCMKDNVATHNEIQNQSLREFENSIEDSAMNRGSSFQNPIETDAPNGSSLESDMKTESAVISEYVSSKIDTSLDSGIADSHSSNGDTFTGKTTVHTSSIQEERVTSERVLETDDKSNDWIWAPATELRRTYRKDLHGGSLQKFEYINAYSPKHLSPIHLNPEEKDSLHFPVSLDGNVISVCEDEISSIIACALALSEYNSDEKEVVEDKTMNYLSSIMSSEGSTASSPYWPSTGSEESEGMHQSRSVSSLSSDELSTSSSESSYFMDRSITSENLHPVVQVGSGKGTRNKYSVVINHSKQFYALRRMCCPSELAYISSLSRCKKWDPQGGKSKAFFAKTLDDRFIIKQVSKTEIESFFKFAPDYFRHISYSVSSGSQTCLAKILGIYQVRQFKGGKEVKLDLMVMENLLFGRNFTRTYDLKGAEFSRYVLDSNECEKVLLDLNFIEDMRIAPIYIAGRNKLLFQRAIWNDTSFLTSTNVMDYSLLVGVDKHRHELVFGIIDYLRQYTWDKQLETWVKSSLVVPKNSLPTVISPKEYKKRFRKFMSKNFLTVPDTWSCEQCSGPCNFCHGVKSLTVESCQGTQISTVSNS